MWNKEPKNYEWERFISYYSKPRSDRLLESEAPFFRKAWSQSPDGQAFQQRISVYKFEVIKDQNGSYCIATNDGRYFDTKEFGVSQREAAAKIGNHHKDFSIVQDAAQQCGERLKNDLPGIRGSYDLLSDALRRMERAETSSQKMNATTDQSAQKTILEKFMDRLKSASSYQDASKEADKRIAVSKDKGFSL
jgi:hypothetical protein